MQKHDAHALSPPSFHFHTHYNSDCPVMSMNLLVKSG